MARNLGEARDHDVLIEFLASSLAGVSDRVLVPGIACLLNHVERQRQWIQPRVLKAIDRFEASGVLKAMQAAVRSILDEAGDAEFVASEYARGQAGKSVRKRLKKLLDEAPGLADPEQHERHHAMRIAAKRLRYTLELARPVYSGESGLDSDLANTAMRSRSSRRFWARSTIAMFGSRISQSSPARNRAKSNVYFGSSQRFERLRPGLDYLRQERKDRRRQVFGELVAFWQELKDQGVWDRLATILEWGSRANAGAVRGGLQPGEVARKRSEIPIDSQAGLAITPSLAGSRNIAALQWRLQDS